jgi:hypothetical protein
MAGVEQHNARAIGLDVLLWITADADRAAAFMQASGASVADIRARAGDDVFLAFVLDHLMQGDDAVLAFCAAHDHSPEQVVAARALLAGGQLRNWT